MACLGILPLSLSSVSQSCPAFCDRMDYSTPGFPVIQQLPQLTQTQAHGVGDAIQPSHPLSSPSPPTFNLSQHQGLFQWVSSSHEVAKVLVSASASVLPMNIQDWFLLGWTGWITLLSKGLAPLPIKLKCLCSELCTCVDGRKEEINTFPA